MSRAARVPRERAEPMRRPRCVCAILTGLAWFAVGNLVIPVVARAQAPGPELFAKPPETPLELWEAVDYLVRSGQADRSVPYLAAFLKSKPSDAILLQIRDQFGAGSIVRLQDSPATRAQAEPLLRMMADASVRQARDPERIRRAVAALTKTHDEQEYAVERLRAAGPYAVPYLVEVLNNPQLSLNDRSLIDHNMGRLDRSAVPALAATLDSPNTVVAADAAEALGRIGDPRAVPFLTYAASQPEDNALREPARRAIARITGRAFNAQPQSPISLLVSEARRYLTHAVVFPGAKVVLWKWDQSEPVPQVVSRGEAEGILGSRFAREALALDPTDLNAQATLVSLAIQKSVERVGLANFPARDPVGAFPLAMASGPTVMGEVVRGALADGLSDLGAAAVMVLGRVADRDALATDDRPHPLVEALSAPDRRVRFAAAQALVNLAPQQNFPGASRVVPVLSQFIATQTVPKIVIIDGLELRANTVASILREYGYDALTSTRGDRGFRLASDSADVEAIFIGVSQLHGSWLVGDTVRNLRADASTAGIPIIVYGALRTRDRIGDLLTSYPRISFTVTPVDAKGFRPIFDREMGRMGVRPLTPAERAGYAEAATSLLATITMRPGSPLNANVTVAEPSLAIALTNPASSLAASVALADVPNADAQRSLADVVLGGGGELPLRLRAADSLARSIQRFGPLVTRDHENQFVAAFDGAKDPVVRSALANIIGALRPKPRSVGTRLRDFSPPASPSAPESVPPPAPTPAPAAVPTPPPPAAEVPEPAPVPAPAPDQAVPPPAGDNAPEPKG